MKVYILDNYDSFTYNLVHYVAGFDCDVTVTFNNQVDYQRLNEADKIILSPGPGLPKESGELLSVISQYHQSKPILGVCLGMQALGEFFNEELINLDTVKHGIQEEVTQVTDSLLFKGIPTKFQVGLYHSWAIKEFENNPNIEITSRSEHNVIMSIQHKKLPIFGVQFHPESILTPYGKQLIENFLSI